MSEENATPEVETPELTPEQRDAASAEKYRAQFVPKGESTAQVIEDDSKPARPENIPEKFWDAEKGEVRVEDLAKSYAELEKSRAKAEEKAIPENETPEEKAAREEAEKAALDDEAKARQTLGLPSVDELSTLRGKLTEKMLAGEEFDDADYAPWEKMGLDRDTVDTFKAGLVALGEVHKQRVYTEVGGEDAYKDMVNWARESFSEEEIAVYDRDIHSRDTAVSLNAVRGLSARYREANGRSGRDVTRQGSSTASDAFKSKAEMVKAMQDPRYKTDASYREEVAQKVHAAAKAGITLAY